MTYFDETKAYWGNQTNKIIGAGDGRLTARSVKIFADGSYDADILYLFLCSSTIRCLTNRSSSSKPQSSDFVQRANIDAQLYEPYTDNPSTRGVMRIEPEALNRAIPQFMKDGWQVVCTWLRHDLISASV